MTSSSEVVQNIQQHLDTYTNLCLCLHCTILFILSVALIHTTSFNHPLHMTKMDHFRSHPTIRSTGHNVGAHAENKKLPCPFTKIRPDSKSSREQPLQFKIGLKPYNVCPALQSSWISDHCLWIFHLHFMPNIEDIFHLNHLSYLPVQFCDLFIALQSLWINDHWISSASADSWKVATEHLVVKDIQWQSRCLTERLLTYSQTPMWPAEILLSPQLKATL